MVTYWQVREPAPGPLKLFVHLLDAESAYMGGEDRLDVWHDNWQAGDLFAQVQEVPLAGERRARRLPGRDRLVRSGDDAAPAGAARGGRDRGPGAAGAGAGGIEVVG